MPEIRLSTADIGKQLSSSGVEKGVDDLIANHGILIFSKTYCPYTPVVQSLLSDELQCTVSVLEINSLEDCNAIQTYLKTKTGHKTVPQVFLEGSFLGIHDDIVLMDQKGELETEVKNQMKGPRQKKPDSALSGPQPLFFFPRTVNKWAIRATGLLSSGISAGLAYGMLATGDSAMSSPYLRLGSAALLADYTLRLVAGGKAAPVAMLGGALAERVKEPVPRPGAPKQFASLCGVMFSGLGFAFYANGNPQVGGGFLAVLALCAGMEGGLDFCLGCEFFHIGEKIYQAVNGGKEKTV